MVRIIGKVDTFKDRKAINIHHMVKVTDMNEITLHGLEVIFAHELNEIIVNQHDNSYKQMYEEWIKISAPMQPQQQQQQNKARQSMQMCPSPPRHQVQVQVQRNNYNVNSNSNSQRNNNLNRQQKKKINLSFLGKSVLQWFQSHHDGDFEGH